VRARQSRIPVTLAALLASCAAFASGVRNRPLRRHRLQRWHDVFIASSRSRATLLLVVVFVVGGFALPSAQSEVEEAQATTRPNIILILADDLDVESASHMPNLQSLLVDQGTEFSNAFVSYSVCCPSRASILRGQYAHNHGVLHNDTPGGGFKKFHNVGDEKSTIATWLEGGDYRTVLLGKYFNGYGSKTDSERYVPPGWGEWYAKLDAGYYDYQLNENGRVVSYGDRKQDYYTDVLAGKARKYVRSASDDSSPFFMYLAPATPHGPFEPAPRHRGANLNVETPKLPSFDEADVSDKPTWVRRLPRLGSADEKKINETYAKRLRMLLSLDEMVAGLIEELRATGQLENTYIFFTSDNGFHLGEHRLSLTKKTPYEEALRVPLLVRGPGVPAGGSVDQMTLNTDFAPTFADLARVPAAEFVDGRSLTPLLDGTSPETWRSAFLLESWPSPDSRNLTYTGIRTETYKYIEHASGARELYDLQDDPYELDSIPPSAEPALIANLKARLAALKACSEQSCRDAEDVP
jgi:N-acetylglucosamine-6-sulfatase